MSEESDKIKHKCDLGLCDLWECKEQGENKTLFLGGKSWFTINPQESGFILSSSFKNADVFIVFNENTNLIKVSNNINNNYDII